MRELPILFSGPMVRALIEGRKSMTRRVLKLEGVKAVEHHGGTTWSFTPEVLDAPMKTKLPQYAKGDHLWVREGFSDCHTMGFDSRFYYMADVSKDSDSDDLRKHYGVKWKPGIHMPGAASRLTLEVSGVKVERLQDISEEDAIAEGIERLPFHNPIFYNWRDYLDPTDGKIDPRDSFETLWQSLNAKRAPWESNPWVVAIAFKAQKQNIDSPPHGAVS